MWDYDASTQRNRRPDYALTSTVNLVINGSSLTVFPGVIPNSLAASTTATLVFVNNANECGDCRKFNQAPLVDWTFASPGRDITLNCLANAKGNYVPLGGGNATDLHDNPDCDLSECMC
ncbi:hypothetical protein BV898_13582 [Hypsibius exemplaris]|uniref:Uncharacterized protein n=1 Tax=Hypsibius exemplaris TaxID=2072580 RepID=A0A1W0WAC6_HYPEX|nr:hypothetical protein BV898_13582 [Hypsibius exemplaris]